MMLFGKTLLLAMMMMTIRKHGDDGDEDEDNDDNSEDGSDDDNADSVVTALVWQRPALVVPHPHSGHNNLHVQIVASKLRSLG